MSVFVPVPYCLDDYSFVIQLEVQDCDASCFGFLFQDCVGSLGSFFWSHTNFRIVCSSSVKNAGVILIGIVTCSIILLIGAGLEADEKKPCR